MCGSFDEAIHHLNNVHSGSWFSCRQLLERYGPAVERFEQHLLTRYDHRDPAADFVELRYRSMSFGLGQILGVNYQKVGAESARAMFVSPLDEQVLFIARFLASLGSVVSRKNPSGQDSPGQVVQRISIH
jgi:hypothetical protein